MISLTAPPGSLLPLLRDPVPAWLNQLLSQSCAPVIGLVLLLPLRICRLDFEPQGQGLLLINSHIYTFPGEPESTNYMTE